MIGATPDSRAIAHGTLTDHLEISVGGRQVRVIRGPMTGVQVDANNHAPPALVALLLLMKC